MPFSLGENGFSTLSSVYTITGTALAMGSLSIRPLTSHDRGMSGRPAAEAGHSFGTHSAA
ncbi:MAG TPA: hypothetical protein VGN16_19385 [Acidobacteriaceae bacterium]